LYIRQYGSSFRQEEQNASRHNEFKP
jgi:hypothetical protein